MLFENIKTPEELMNFFKKKLQYGFTYNGKVFLENEPNFNDNFNKFYKLRLGKNFIEEGYGVCWDFCELERLFFKEKGIEHECYFLESFANRAEGGPTHTFALYKSDDKWNWFEYSWSSERGIKAYKTKEEALSDILQKYIKFCGCKATQVGAYKIKKINKRLNAFEFVEFCLNSEGINIKKLVESENRKI